MKELFDFLMQHPHETKSVQVRKGDHIIEEKFECKNDQIVCELRCCTTDKPDSHGEVTVDFYVSRFKTEHRAGFADLIVPTAVNGKGIGTALMLESIELIRAFKDYFGMSGTEIEIVLSGWLSDADKHNNWPRSVPFYEMVGERAGVKCYFDIGSDPTRYTAAAFLEKANKDGHVRYII